LSAVAAAEASGSAARPSLLKRIELWGKGAQIRIRHATAAEAGAVQQQTRLYSARRQRTLWLCNVWGYVRELIIERLKKPPNFLSRSNASNLAAAVCSCWLPGRLKYMYLPRVSALNYGDCKLANNFFPFPFCGGWGNVLQRLRKWGEGEREREFIIRSADFAWEFSSLSLSLSRTTDFVLSLSLTVEPTAVLSIQNQLLLGTVWCCWMVGDLADFDFHLLPGWAGERKEKKIREAGMERLFFAVAAAAAFSRSLGRVGRRWENAHAAEREREKKSDIKLLLLLLLLLQFPGK
jgi:hypothetical protein